NSKRYLARHIVVATTVDARRGTVMPHGFHFVVDAHAGGTPLTGTTQHHQSYADNESEGAIYMTQDLPAHAQERLKGLCSSAQSRCISPSDVPVHDSLLVRKAGLEPIGLCVGSCVYHVGIQYGSWSRNQELEVLSKAMYHARELAMSRMRAEATAMGADGIV